MASSVCGSAASSPGGELLHHDSVLWLTRGCLVCGHKEVACRPTKRWRLVIIAVFGVLLVYCVSGPPLPVHCILDLRNTMCIKMCFCIHHRVPVGLGFIVLSYSFRNGCCSMSFTRFSCRGAECSFLLNEFRPASGISPSCPVPCATQVSDRRVRCAVARAGAVRRFANPAYGRVPSSAEAIAAGAAGAGAFMRSCEYGAGWELGARGSTQHTHRRTAWCGRWHSEGAAGRWE